MTARDLYKQGDLTQAIQAQLAEVRAHPADHNHRLFLFELLVFAGDLDRARKHLEVLQYDSPEQILALSTYKQLLDAEQARRKLFTDGLAPQFFSEQPAHVGQRLQAIQKLRESKPEEAAQLLRTADVDVPVLRGQLNGKAFEGIRDGDDIFGPILEVHARGQYFWVPLEYVASIACNPPKYARDLIWQPARLDLLDGSSGEVHLPALYVDSYTFADPVKLGRVSEFSESEPVRGRGSKLFLVGDDAIPLLAWRELKFDLE